MKHIFKITLMLILSINISFSTEPINIKKDITSKLKILGGGCLAPTSQSYLDIGNVRAMILGGGDMWWNLSAAQYEVPKDSDLHSIFAGALWIGGLDDNDNLSSVRVTPKDIKASNYGFDTTPRKFITGLITEKGVLSPNEESIKKAFNR